MHYILNYEITEINTFIKQGLIKLIKSDDKYIYICYKYKQ